jgi:HAE1 family hydrophobic/amphiphilic exporter-1
MGVDEVMFSLRSENIDTPLGRVNRNGSEVPLRVQGKAKSVEQFRSIVVSNRGGRPIALGEVADVTDGAEEIRSLAIVNGTPAVALDVLKQTGANAVGVADAIKKEIAVIQPDLPEGVKVDLVRDGSVFIRESVADVEQTMLLGGLLTIFIVFLFLNSWRSTVITGLTLPISVISSFIMMNFAGMTLNVMTLMALSLAIGLLIDDAIVVRENIVRHLEHGEDHMEAARHGTSEIGLAVLATSFSIIAVFVPVAFMKGIVGRFFFAFGITVAFAVAVSLFVSFTLDPMLSSRWVDPDIARTGKRNPISRLLDYFNRWFDRTADRYRGVMGWALDHRPTVIAVAFAAFIGGLAIMGMLENEFFPQFDQGEFVVGFKTAPSASIDETRDRMQAVLGLLKGLPEVESTYASIGAGDAGTVRDGRVYIKLKPRAARTRDQKAVERQVRAGLLRIPGIIGSLAQAESMDNRKPLLVDVRGEDIGVLKQYSQRLKDLMYRIPGVVDLEATLEHDTPEYRLIVDRERAADVGLSTGVIANSVGALVGGQVVTTFEDEEGEARNVRVRLPAALRQDPTQVEGLRLAVHGPAGVALLPVGSVARYAVSTTPSEINRMDLSRQVEIGSNLDGVPLGTAVAKINEAGKTLNLPPGYTLVVGGENEAMVESFGYMAEALILAIIFVYLILAAQFESFVHPLSIMLSLPLSVVGMAGMLFLTHDTVNIISLIGLIMLMGLVTKNAILLVDFANVLRSRGLDRRHALIEAGRTRLRPIIMTTSAMVFGMLPLALAIGSGGEMRAPMARAVIGGLITSTLLTLIVVPVVYTVLDDLTAWLFRRKRAAATVTTAVVAVALLALPSPVRAQFGGLQAQKPVLQGLSGETKTLTLQEALAIAAEHNRDVQKAAEYQKWVRGKYMEERAAALPQINVSGSVLRTFDNTQSRLFSSVDLGSLLGGSSGSGGSSATQFGDIFTAERQDVRSAEVKVTQPIFTWGQVGAAMRAARVGFALADDQLRQARQTVVRDVTTAFYDVLVSKELASIAEQDLEQKGRHLDETKRRQAAGTVTDYEVLAAEVAVQNARPPLIRAQNGVRVARDQLRFLLAETATDVDVVGSLDVQVRPTPAFEDVLTGALKNRPELSQLANQARVYNELVTIAKAGNKPRLDFSGALGTRNLALKYLSATGMSWNAAVIGSIPLFDGDRTKGRVAQAQSDLMSAKLDELKVRESVTLQVRTAFTAVKEAEELLTASAGTVNQAERLLSLAEKGFELGVKTHLEVQDAQLNLQAARANLARARRDYHVAEVTLDWVAGNLNGGPPRP